MKIIEFIPQLGIGGAERFCIDLSNELAAKHEVILCVSHPISKEFHYITELSSNVKLICLNKKKGLDWKLPFRILKLIRLEKPDIVHTHLMSIVYVALSALVNKKVKYFHTVHNAALQESDGRIGGLVRKYLFSRDKINPVTISKDSERSFEDFYGFAADMVFNGRDLPQEVNPTTEVRDLFSTLRKSSETKVIVQLAHVGFQKRQIVMAQAINRLNKEGHDVIVLMIGSLDDSSMVNEIKSLNNPNIHLLGAKSNPLDYLFMADGFGLSSEYEGLPIALIEALGMGAVPVCTPVGGIVDLVQDGFNGFLSQTIGEEDYYAALKRFVILDKQRLDKMKQAARESYRPFSMKTCASLYEKLFKTK